MCWMRLGDSVERRREPAYKAPMLTAHTLECLDSLRHGFFTRAGGVSEGPYESLNCGLGSGDDPARVHENRRRAMDRLGLPAGALVTAYQVHSAYVAWVEAAWPSAARPQVDGLVTRTPGLALGILTADCAPVLLADPRAGVVGAAHAGWRGARAGILEATVRMMVEAGAQTESIRAAIGPCISRDCYEVGPEFRETFLAEEPPAATLFRAREGTDRYLFDLPAYVAGRLRALGIGTLSVLPFDTFAEQDRFFSYRRVTLAGGGDYGRLLSAISLAP